jgi:glucose-1-phosphate thymidylyltransferase
MNIIVPVAGEGMRLRPHTHTQPKCLLYVAGKPILGHILDGFKGFKISRLVIVLGTKSDSIIKFCKKYSYNFKFVAQEKRLGLGHAIYTGAKGLQGSTMVLLGDTIIDCDFKDFTNRRTNMLAVKAVENPKRFGIVETKGVDVIGLEEKPLKPKSNLAILGLYYFQHIERVHKAVAYLMKRGIKTKGEYQLTDALKHLLEIDNRFKIMKVNKWFDCGTADALIETNRHLLKKTHHFKKRKNTIILPPVYISNTARISNAIIGPNVSIGEGATIENALIRDSIINKEAYIQNTLLAESIIGEKACIKGQLKKLSVSDSSVIEFP